MYNQSALLVQYMNDLIVSAAREIVGVCRHNDGCGATAIAEQALAPALTGPIPQFRIFPS